MTLRPLPILLLTLALAACGQGDREKPAPAQAAPAATAEPAAEPARPLETYYFVVPSKAVTKFRLDPTEAVGEAIVFRRIALVDASGNATTMDACAPRGVERVRVASVKSADGACEIVFGDKGNSGWMALTPFGNLPAAAGERHIEIEMTAPSGGAPHMLFDTGKSFNYVERLKGAASLDEARQFAAKTSAAPEASP